MKCNNWTPEPNIGLPLQEGEKVCRWWLGGTACRLHIRRPCETEGRQSLPEQVKCHELDSGKVLIPEEYGAEK